MNVSDKVKKEKRAYDELMQDEVNDQLEETTKSEALVTCDSTGYKMVDALLKEYYSPEVRERLKLTRAQVKMLSNSLRTLNKNILRYSAPITCKGPQCHPPSSLIRTNAGDIRIEDITDDHVIAQYYQNSNSIYLPKKKYKHILGSRQYNGLMHTMVVADRSYECTSDHICIAKWNDLAKTAYCVYLMRRGSHWRIGHVKLFKEERNQSQLSARCLTENADEAWILGIYDTKKEAYFMEDYYSIQFSTSKMCFMAMTYRRSKWDGSTKWSTQEELDAYHDSLFKSDNFYGEKLNSIGLLLNKPMWKRGEDNRKGIRSAFDIEACNVISGYMNMAYDIGQHLISRRNVKARWTKVVKVSRDYNGKVYSLGVEPYNTYIVNDVVTHNCYMADRCPVQKAKCAPISNPCVIEMMLIDEWERAYIVDLDVDMQSKVELDMVRDMIEADLIDWRTSHEIATNGIFDLQAIGIDERTKKPIIRKEEAIAIGIKLKFKTRKDKLREDLMATRKIKAKFGVNKQIDPSRFASDINQKFKDMQNADEVEE